MTITAQDRPPIRPTARFPLPWKYRPSSGDLCGGTPAPRVKCCQGLPEPGPGPSQLIPSPPAASDQASATTGGALRVDGGYVDSILP